MSSIDGSILATATDAASHVMTVTPSGDTTGITDAVVLQAAINATQSTATGSMRTVVMDAGDWYLSTPITIGGSGTGYNAALFGKFGISLKGAGVAATRVHSLITDGPVFQKLLGFGISFEDFMLIGPGSEHINSIGIFGDTVGAGNYYANLAITAFGTGIRLNDQTLSNYHLVQFSNNNRHVELGYVCDVQNFFGCRFQNARETAVFAGWEDATHHPGQVNQSKGAKFVGCRFGENANVFDVTDVGAYCWKVWNCYFENNQHVAYLGRVDHGGVIKSLEFDACTFTNHSKIPAGNAQIELRNVAAVGGMTIKNCRAVPIFPGPFLLAGKNFVIDWDRNDISATGYLVRIDNGAGRSISYTATELPLYSQFSFNKAVKYFADGASLRANRPFEVRLKSGTNEIFQAWEHANPNDGGNTGSAQAYVRDIDARWVVFDGVMRLGTPSSALPAPSAAYRGVMLFQPGSVPGAPDTIVCCMRGASGAYSWKVVATG